MLVVHHLNYSRSLRLLWALEELGLDYEMKEYQRDTGFRAPAEARDIHPLGRFPMLDMNGQVLAESGAILEELALAHERLRPTSEQELREYRFFLHYAEGSAMPPLLVALIAQRIRSAPVPFLVRPIARKIAEQMEQGYSEPAIDLHFGFVEQTLASRPYFAGRDFTMADIQMFFPVEAALARSNAERPVMKAWRDRVTARPAYARALARGGPAVRAADAG